MRIALIVLILVVLAAAISPGIVGSKVETSIREQLALYEDLPMYEINIDAYEKGFRSSEMTLSVGFDDAFIETVTSDMNLKADSSIPSSLEDGFKIYMDIQHGPVLTEHGLGLGWADISMNIDRETYPEMAEFFDQAGVDSILNWDMRTGLTGTGWIKQDIPDLNVEIPAEEGADSFHFTLLGVDGDSTFTGYGTNWKQNGGVEEITLKISGGDAGVISFKNLSVDADVSLDNSIWFGVGDANFAIESATFQFADDPALQVDDFIVEIAMSNGDTSETFNISESFQFASGAYGDAQVTDAELTISYENISKALLEAYMAVSGSAYALDPETMRQEMTDQLSDVGMAALEYSPRFNIDRIAFEYDGGEMDSSASFGINADKLTLPIDIENPITLLPALDMTADLKINEALVKAIMLMQSKSQMEAVPEADRPTGEQLQQMVDMQIGMMAGPLIQQGYIVQEGDNYSANLKFSDGAAVINGQQIPLPF